MILPIVLFALLGATFVWVSMVEIVDQQGRGVFGLAQKADAPGLLALFDAGFVGLGDLNETEKGVATAMLVLASVLFGGGVFSLFIRAGRNDLRDFCLPFIIISFAVFLATPTLLLPLAHPGLICAVVPVVIVGVAGGVCLWNNKAVLIGATITALVIAAVPLGHIVSNACSAPDYRPVQRYLGANAGDTPIVHLDYETYNKASLYHDSNLQEYCRPLWVITKPELRDDSFDLPDGGEMLIVFHTTVLNGMAGGDEKEFQKRILQPDWQVVETHVFGEYMIYRVRNVKKKIPFEMDAM